MGMGVGGNRRFELAGGSDMVQGGTQHPVKHWAWMLLSTLSLVTKLLIVDKPTKLFAQFYHNG